MSWSERGNWSCFMICAKRWDCCWNERFGLPWVPGEDKEEAGRGEESSRDRAEDAAGREKPVRPNNFWMRRRGFIVRIIF